MADSKDSKIQISSNKNIIPYSNQLIKRGMDLVSKIQQRIIRVPQDFPDLEEAVEKANTGDTIEISDGNYFVKLDINKSLILRGKTQDHVLLRPKDGYIAQVESSVGIITFDNISFDGIVSNKNQLPGNLPNPDGVIILEGAVNFYNCLFENFEQNLEYFDYLFGQNMIDKFEPCSSIIVKSGKSKVYIEHCEFRKNCEVGIDFANDVKAILSNNLFATQVVAGSNCHITSNRNYFNSGSNFSIGKNSILLSNYDTFQSSELLNSSSKCLANFVHATIVVSSLFGHAVGRELINPDINQMWTQGRPKMNIIDSIVIVRESTGAIRYSPSAQDIKNDQRIILLDPINENLVEFSGSNLIQIPHHYSSPNPKLVILSNEIQLEPDSPAIKSASDGKNIGAWQSENK